jgi:hypothetical protein
MIVVVRTPRGKAAEALVRRLLPSRIVLVTPTGCYSLFTVDDATPVDPFAFKDPADGEVLAEYRAFDTFEQARVWVREDTDRHRKAGRLS